MTTRIAVIGAGNVGGNLGATLSNAGFPVRYGVKPGSDAKGVPERSAKNASAGTPQDVASWAEVIFLALPVSVVLDVARSLASELAGKIVVDCNNPLTWKDGPVWAPPAEGSLAQAIARAVPGARVVKGFNTFGAEFHADPKLAGGAAQVFFAGDDADAKKVLTQVATQAGFDPVDAGPLRNAPVLENLAILWIHLATVGGKGRDFAFSMAPRTRKP